MDHHGQFSLDFLVNREQPGIIDIEPLAVGMDFQTFQTHGTDPFHFFHEILHARMNGAKTGEAGMFFGLFQGKAVDAADMFRFYCHGKNQIVGHTDCRPTFQQRSNGAVHIISQVVVIPDAPGCFCRNGIRIHMGMYIDEFHRDRLFFNR